MNTETKQNQKREDWETYFMNIAKAVSTRSTCLRRKVGCVIAKDKKIISTGYNGSPKGLLHCCDVGCLLNKEGRCIRTIHAEQNALLQANEDVTGATLYTTCIPCPTCFKLLIQAGILYVYYHSERTDNKGVEDLQPWLDNPNSLIFLIKYENSEDDN